MKIINKEEFYKLPSGTLYSEYEPCIISELKIKQETIFGFNGEPIDWFYQDLIGNVKENVSLGYHETLEQSREDKASIELDFDSIERDGCFVEEQLFAVYEKGDLEGLISKLESLRSAY